MSWLLLAVFVALAGLSAAAWHAQVQRQNDQAFAAQAASVGASVTTAVRRMDDLTLAARTLLATNPDLTNEDFESWYDAMGVDERFSGIAGFAYVAIERGAGRRRSIRPASARTTACRGSACPARAWTESLQEAAVPGLRPLPAHEAARRDARLRRVQRVRGQLLARPRDVRGGRAGLSRRRRAEDGGAARGRAPRAGSSASSTPSRSCAPRSPASSASTSRSPASTRRCLRTACRPAPARPSARWPRRSAAPRSPATARRRRRPR